MGAAGTIYDNAAENFRFANNVRRARLLDLKKDVNGAAETVLVWVITQLNQNQG